MTNTRTSSHIRTSTRRKGQRLSAQEREVAQHTFLKAFAVSANVRAACLAAGIDRSAIHQWLEKDVPFTILYHAAEKDADDVVRAAVFQRGVHGYEKPVVSMGRVVYEEVPVLGADGKSQCDSKGKPLMKQGKPLMERVYSDALLALLAKARMKEFREKQQVDVTTTHPQETQDLHMVITQALASYPEAKIAVAEALMAVEKARTRDK